ncbi:MAG TPA: cupin domain-containing protein [Terriglobales bacterium]|jgi:mannose-6-phosphate isomerase-like protein (cupin superfamily)
MESIRKVNLVEALASFSDRWSPKIAGELNGQHVKLAKLQGEFVWHHHDHEDELFLVLDGHLRIELLNQPPVELAQGEFVIIPRGVEHRPVAEAEVALLLFEPVGTLNTGNVESTLTVRELARLS